MKHVALAITAWCTLTAGWLASAQPPGDAIAPRAVVTRLPPVSPPTAPATPNAVEPAAFFTAPEGDASLDERLARLEQQLADAAKEKDDRSADEDSIPTSRFTTQL